ncbi:MAG: hypothetical protein HFE76_06725 [Firmicutes bacterium]|nr:hypothetical protein [Bacillota bacterium]
MDKKYVKAWKYGGRAQITVTISETGKKEDEIVVTRTSDEKKALEAVKHYMKKGYASYEKMREEAYDEEVAAKLIEDMLFGAKKGPKE